jgi:hypothetical protein
MIIPSPLRVAQPEAQGIPKDPNTWITSLEEVIKCISESTKAMKKTNEDITSQLPHRKESGHEERHKPKGKEKVQDGHEEEESSIHDNHHTATQSEKSSSNKRSHSAETPTQQSSKEESSYRPSRHSRPSKTEDRKIKVDQDVKDLKEKIQQSGFSLWKMGKVNQRLNTS